MKRTLAYALFLALLAGPACAQEDLSEKVTENPIILYSASPRKYEIAEITVTGITEYEERVLANISGLHVGQSVYIPGDDITEAAKRYWKHGMFSYVNISAKKIVGNKIYLNIDLALRPKVTDILYHDPNKTGENDALKKGEIDDLEEKIGLMKGGNITPNMLTRAEKLIRRYYDDKGFKNADIKVVQRDDPGHENSVFIDIYVDKKDKVKVNDIILTGNSALSDKDIMKVMKKTNKKGYLRDFFRTKKFIDDEFSGDKDKIIEKYNELGYRDAIIVADSVVGYDDKTVNVYLTLDEGDKYYLRNIEWVGNTVYPSEILDEYLNMKGGDVYNQKKLGERISTDDDAIGNLYYNNGYVFYDLNPVEVNVVGDSVDLEMRIVEGPQATINRVNIYGNERLYENVVRRELYTRPGDLFSKDALERSYREIGQMGHFNPENIQPDVKPNTSDGTVDINWNLESKSNDQVELSMGWGQTGLIGRAALKFTNFSMYNLFHKSDNYRAFIPQGDGQTFSISGQTNGSFYHSYSISFLEPWLGGKRPNSLSISAFYSKQSDISDTYYNSAYYNNYYQYMYGYGYGGYGYGGYGNNYYNYDSYYDPDKYISLMGVSAGWGTRLHWPDDYFVLYGELSFTRYNMKNWDYFLIQNGASNNINVGITLSRSTTDNPIFPRKGSDFSFSVSLTPPYSLWDNVDYEHLALDRNSANYQKELQQKYKWIEYNKWKFKSKTYTALTNGQKCLVLMTRADFGILGSYNRHKKSPFETFYMGGDGMTGASYTYATEMVGLRGYENGSLGEGYAYTRLSAELRFPVMMENSTTIYGLAFVEGGNTWTSVKKFNPFDLKRSAGVGVRVYLPMIGLMGLDWGYGFDPVFGSRASSGSQIHFILGQEF